MFLPIVLAWLLGKYATSGLDAGLSAAKSDAQWLLDQAQHIATPAVLTTLAVVLAAILVSSLVFVLLVNARYKALVKDNKIDIDPWVQEPTGPALMSKFKLLFTAWMSIGSHKTRTEPVPLGESASTHMPGLKVSVKEGEEGAAPHTLTGTKAALRTKPIVVGTIRMGFGHHRIAYAACSWNMGAKNSETYFHDLLNIDSPEANLIKDMDKVYSKCSRMASEMGGLVEKMWGAMTLSGGADTLRATYFTAEAVKPLLMGLPKETPIVASHCLVALSAVACGFKNVINLVIDNHAQWFVVVPGALNLVQGPTNYHNLLKMGVPPSELRLAGHWIPKDLVDNLKPDCNARIQRAKAGKPLRMLMPVGGAGAQRKFVSSLVKALGPRIQQGHVQLFLNAGDHEHMKEAFVEALDAIKQDYDVVDSMQGVHTFCDTLRKGQEPSKPVTLFAFKEYFPAVAATDVLCRVTDVLACKPSELAFYPVPKLMIRRVGDHEAYSALRASELGDGTLEAREVKDALRYIEVFKDIPGSPALVSMNEMIMKNGQMGIYDGCKNAIEIAQQM